MYDIDLTPTLKEKMKSYPRTVGRYNSSELYFITRGWTTPEKFLSPEERKIEEIIKMWKGIGMHNQLEELLGKEHCEKKREFTYKGIILVAKADHFPPSKPNEVWEFKTADKLYPDAKPWHEHQAKLYTTMFEVDYGRIYQPIQNEDGLYLKCLGSVERDDKWFQEQLEKLVDFHKRVEKLRKTLL